MLAVAGAEVDAADDEHAVDPGEGRGKRLRSIEIERSDLSALRGEVGDLVRIARAGDDAAGLFVEKGLDDAAAELAGSTGDEENRRGGHERRSLMWLPIVTRCAIAASL